MGTTAQKLQAIANSKAAIKAAIEAKGVSDVGNKLSDYAGKIGQISGGGGSTKYGMTIDSLFGDVDSTGQLQLPSTSFSFSSTEIESISDNVLQYKFYNNTGLTSVNLPNLTNANTTALNYAFSGCTNLTSVNLPKLASGSLYYTFQKCTSLTSVELPEFNGSLFGVFNGCSNLVSFSAPKMTVGQLSSSPFSGCTKLQEVYLPLFNGNSVSFQQCSSLKKVEMPCYSNSYYYVFNNCSSLEYVNICDITKVPTINNGTFNNVPETCEVFVPNRLYASMMDSAWGSYADKRLKRAFYQIYFKSVQANSTVSIQAVGNAPVLSLEYHTNNGHWTPYVIGDVITLTSVGDWVYFRAKEVGNQKFSTDGQNYNHFVVTGQLEVNDSPFYLIDWKGNVPSQIPSGCFQGMFKGCSSLTGWINLMDMDDSGAARTFANAFENSSINQVEASNMATVGEGGFYEAFKGNTSIQVVNFPRLTSCSGASSFGSAFKNCTSLLEARFPRLSTTTGTSFDDAFNGCTSLQVVDFSLATAIPQITSTTFANTNSTFEIRVPQSLYDAWKVAPNWSEYSSQIVAVQTPSYTGLNLTARQANSSIYFSETYNGPSVLLDYSLDYGQSWIRLRGYPYKPLYVKLPQVGDTVCVKATTTNQAFGRFGKDHNSILGTGELDASGILESVLDSQNYETMTVLPAYGLMGVFAGNTALVDASRLKIVSKDNTATYGLAEAFSECTNLVKGPEIFLETLANATFSQTFFRDAKLNEIKIHYTGSFGGEPFTIWVMGVKTTEGTFYYNGSDTTRGNYAIPEGWTITPFAT